MKRATFVWTCGYLRKGGPNQTSWHKVIYVESDSKKGDLLLYVRADFPKECREQFHIDFENWFREPGVDSIPDEEFESLKLNRVISTHAQNKFTFESFFKLWVTLLSKVRPDIAVKERRMLYLMPIEGVGLRGE